MALHLFDITPDQLQQIQMLVGAGRFAALEQFVATAIRNQLLLETQGTPPDPPLRKSADLVARAKPESGRLDPLERNERSLLHLAAMPKQVPEAVAAMPARGPLFGQYYRFLPLKVVAREIGVGSQTRLLDLDEVAKRVARTATEIGRLLRAEDADESFHLSTGFPSTDRDADKSKKRFVGQYLGRPRPRRALDGFGADMGFFGITADEVPRIGLTEAGFRFANLSNPVLDSNERSALSEQEVAFLLDWMKDELADEYEHMETILGAVASGSSTPQALTTVAWEYYKRRFPRETWTDAKVTLTRSGVSSRLQEMGLLASSKEGSRVSYTLTRGGSDFLDRERMGKRK